MTYSCPDFVDDVLEALGVEVPDASSDSPADQADLAIAAIRRLQAAAAMLPAIADTFRDVCETHVYDESNGDKHPADCPLCKAIADADALAPATDTPAAIPASERPTVRKVCGTCGGDNVMRDAWAVWCVEAQEWELGTVFDAAHCDDCDGRTTIEDAE